MTQRTKAFALLFAWCAALLVARVTRSGSMRYGFLVWNLFLAWIPAFAASRLERSDSQLRQAGWLALWLAFLPNAPYIVTDFIHLRPKPGVPLWYDVALLISFAMTGVLLGYVSVADVQRFVARRFGDATAWAAAASALVLSGVGIYLGRFLRWNSWDLLANPVAIVLSIGPRAISVTLVYGFGLVVGYLVFRSVGPGESAGQDARLVAGGTPALREGDALRSRAAAPRHAS